MLHTAGLVNPTCTGIIGSGVVVHIPSFFAELDALQDQGAWCPYFILSLADLPADFNRRPGLH
jgi:adenylosuccinate synthase